MKILSMSITAVLAHGCLARKHDKRAWLTTEVKQEYPDQVLINSAGGCELFFDNICSTFGLVERAETGVFERQFNASELLAFVPYDSDTEPVVFQSPKVNSQLHKPVFIVGDIWLVRVVKDGETRERFHLFDTKTLQLLDSKETNLYDLPGHERWQKVKYFGSDQWISTDLGQVFEVKFGGDAPQRVSFSLKEDLLSAFGNPTKLDTPLFAVDSSSTLRVGIVGGELLYLVKSGANEQAQKTATRVPFMENVGPSLEARVVFRNIVGGYIAVSFVRGERYFTRYITFSLRWSLDESRNVFEALTFEDREGIEFSEYRYDETVLRVLPKEKVNADTRFFQGFQGTMVRESTRFFLRSINLDMKLAVETKQFQQVQLDNSLGTRFIHDVACDEGECLAALVGENHVVSVYYTNEGNLQYKWALRAQAAVYDGASEVSMIQVVRESSGSWFVMVMMTSSKLLFARVEPMDSAGMIWFVPFKLPGVFKTCGMYASPRGQVSKVACAKAENASGDVFSFVFSESDYEPKGATSFQESSPVKPAAIQWGGNLENFLVLLDSPNKNFAVGFTSGPGSSTFSNDGFTMPNVAYFRDGLVRVSSANGLSVQTRSWQEYWWSTDYKTIDIEYGYNDNESLCKYVAVTDNYCLVSCWKDNQHLDTLLVNIDKASFHGLSLTPSADCKLLGTRKGTILEVCVDFPSQTMTSKAVQASWDSFDSLRVQAEEPASSSVLNEESSKLMVPLVVVSSLLGVGILSGAAFFAIRKRSRQRSATQQQVFDTEDVIMARAT